MSLCLLQLSGCGYWVSDAKRLEQAAQAKQRGAYALASVELRNVLQKQPDHRQARLELVDTLLLNGETQAANIALEPLRAEEHGDAGVAELRARIDLANGDARNLLERINANALALPPARAALMRGQAQLALGDANAAHAEFDQALLLEPDMEEARLGLAQVYAVRNEIERALVEVAALASAAMPNPRALRLRGMLLGSVGEPVASLNALMAAHDRAGGHLTRVEITTLLAACIEQQLTLSRITDAEATLRVLLEHDAAAALTIFSRAQVAVAQKDHASAAADLQALLGKQPGFFQARMLLANVLYAQERWGQAEQQALQVVAEQPQHVDARVLLGRLYMRDQRAVKAVEILAPVFGTDKSDAAALAIEAQQTAARSEPALAELSALVARKPSDEALRMAVAATYVRSGDNDKALQLLQQDVPGGRAAANPQRIALILAAVATKSGVAGARREAERLAQSPAADGKTLVAIGRFFAQVRQWESAQLWLQRAADRQSDDVLVRLELARVALAAGDVGSAERATARVLAAEPDNLLAHLLVAECAAKRGNLSEAARYLQRAREKYPWAVQPVLALAALRIQQGALPAANTDLRAVRELAGERAGALSDVARLWVAAKNPAEAAETLRVATTLQPGSARLWAQLADVELARGEFTAAHAVAQKAFGIQPDVVSLRLLTQTQSRQNQHAVALKVIRDFRAARPADWDAAELEGDVLLQMADYASAAQLYEDILQQLSKPQASEGAARELLPDAERANATTDHAIAIRGSVIAAKAAQARRMGKQPDPNAPLKAWVKRYDVPAARLALADGFRAEGDLPQAISAYQQVLARVPNDITALNNLAVAYSQAGDPRALETARRAYGLQPRLAAVADTYGWILLRSGRVSDALPLLKAAAADGDSPEIGYHYAAALSQAGQIDEARKVLQEALTSSAEFEGRTEAEQLFQRLQSVRP